jgi:hypothetical protein
MWSLFLCGRRPVWAALERLLTTAVRMYMLLNIWTSTVVPSLWFVEPRVFTKRRAAVQPDKVVETLVT